MGQHLTEGCLYSCADLFVPRDLCAAPRAAQGCAVLCLRGEDEQPAVSGILRTSRCWREKRLWWGRRHSEQQVQAAAELLAAPPGASGAKTWSRGSGSERRVQLRHGLPGDGTAQRGDAELQPAAGFWAPQGCLRNPPSPPALWWACFILLPLGLPRLESPRRQKFNGQSSGRRNAARPGKFGLPGNGDTGCDAGARSNEFTAAPRVGRHMIKNA